MLRSDVWTPVNPSAGTEMKVNRHGMTIDFQGDRNPVNGATREKGQHTAEKSLEAILKIKIILTYLVELHMGSDIVERKTRTTALKK